jgi:hypothetical protein
VIKDCTPQEDGYPEDILPPEVIATRIGGISVKSLGELIRKHGLETTTLGYAGPSRRGGPPRRIWGMNQAQFQALVITRERQALGRLPR